jgi:uncharacterized protein YjbI with pentapeptide repeats
MKFEQVLSYREKRALRGKVFSGRCILGVDLAGADLRDAAFLNVQILSCNLADADLRGARFVGCTIRDVVLSRARLGLNVFLGTKLTEIGGLTDAQRREVELSGGLFTVLVASSGPR